MYQMVRLYNLIMPSAFGGFFREILSLSSLVAWANLGDAKGTHDDVQSNHLRSEGQKPCQPSAESMRQVFVRVVYRPESHRSPY